MSFSHFTETHGGLCRALGTKSRGKPWSASQGVTGRARRMPPSHRNGTELAQGQPQHPWGGDSRREPCTSPGSGGEEGRAQQAGGSPQKPFFSPWKARASVRLGERGKATVSSPPASCPEVTGLCPSLEGLPGTPRAALSQQGQGRWGCRKGRDVRCQSPGTDKALNVLNDMRPG